MEEHDEENARALVAVLESQSRERDEKRAAMLQYDLADLSDVFHWFETRLAKEAGGIHEKLDIALSNQRHINATLNWFSTMATVLLLLILWRAW